MVYDGYLVSIRHFKVTRYMKGNRMPSNQDQATTESLDTQLVYSCVSSRMLLDQISDKWSVLILGALCDKPLRFNEIRRCVDGVTQKALTQSLRRLERSGILLRRVIPSSQVAVEYSVTPLGRTLAGPFMALLDWTTAHAAEVARAQEQFDADKPR
jgi:DNA-binding HxlR family transcriptional regulator